MKQITSICRRGGRTTNYLLTAVFAFAMAQTVQADDIVWQDDAAARGTEESPVDMYNAAKWDPAYLPSSSQVPFFTDGGMTYVINGCPNAASTPIGANAAINGDFTFLGDYYYDGELFAPYAKAGMLRDTVIVKKGNWSMSRFHPGPSDQPANLLFKNVSGDLTIRGMDNISVARYPGFSVTIEKDTGNWTIPKGFYLGRGDNTSSTFYHRGGNMDVASAADEWFCLGKGLNSVNDFYMTGGTLTTHSWFLLGGNTSTTGGRNYFEISNATVTQTGLNGVFIGYQSSGHNELCVKEGGTFNAKFITIGNDEPGKGMLTVDGGDVNVVDNLTIANTSAPGAVTLNGGRLTANKVLSAGNGNASLVFNGGTLRAKRTGTLIDVSDKLTVTVGAYGGTIDCAGFSPTVKEDLYDASGASGGMTFKGGGSVTLGGSIAYTGGTTIEAGTTLLVDTAAKKDAILGSGLNTLKFIPSVVGTYTLVTITGEDVFTDGDELKPSVVGSIVTDATFALSSDKKSLTVTVGPTLVFPGATLADLATHTLRARMGGSSFDADGVEATFFNRVATVENDILTKVTYQLQAIDDNLNDNQWTKAAKVEFTADASGVYVKLVDGNYSNYGYQNQFGMDPLESNPGTSNYIPYDFQLVEPATAISVNFTEGGNNLDTSSSVRYGAGDYAVPYSSWSNMASVKGNTATYGGATIKITETSGGWYCGNLSSTKDLRRGYLDDSGGSVVIDVTNIPYEFYRIVTYHATDNANVTFGYVKINDTRYTGITDATVKGNSAWGATASSHYALGFREGVNYLVSDVMSASSATITGHRASPARGCIAAIQIVEYVPPVYTATISDGGAKIFSALDWDKPLPDPLAESDQVVINVNQDTTLTIDSALDVHAINFNVAEGKTLTLAGSNVAAKCITATGLGQTVVASASQLSGTGKIAVESGTMTINGFDPSAVLSYTTASGATLAIVDPGLATMAIDSFNNQGTIDLTGTALREAALNLGTGVTTVGTIRYPATFEKFLASPADQAIRSLAGFTPPTLPEGATYYVTLAETREEFGKGSMVVTNIAANVNVRVARPNGTFVDVVPVDGTVALTGTPQIYGAATAFDFTYTNTAACAYSAPGLSIGWNADENPLTYNNENADKTTGAYIKHHPWVNGAGDLVHDLENFTIVLVGTMSPSHSTQFFHMGTTGSGSTGLLITTTENEDEVLIAKNTGAIVDAAGGVKASVPNAATARHAYVINKKGTVFEVWVDGVKRGQFDGGEGFTLSAGGMQVGSDHGGAIKNAQTYHAVPFNDTETGCVNVLRMFDYAISDAQAEAVFAEYPYASQGGLYTRTVAVDGTFSETDAWAKEGAVGTFAVPVGATVDDVYYNPSATLDVDAASEIEVNADVALDTFTVGGSAPLTFKADGGHTVMVAGAAIINSPITNEYGAVYLAGAPVQLGSSGSICFDCSGFDMSGIYVTNRYQLTGLIERDDAKVTIIPPTGVMSRTAAISYNTTGSCYDFVVMPDHEAGSDIYYKSGTFADGSADLVVVLADGTTQTMIFPGDNIVFDDAVVGENAVVQFGETLPANATFSFGNWTGMVVPTQPSSMYVWTGEVGDGKANTAGNWYGSLTPPVGAAVYIPSKTVTIDNDIDGFAPASITFGYGNGVVTIGGNAITGVAAITNLSSSTHVIDVPVTFAQDVVLNYSDFPIDFEGGATGRTLVLTGRENGGWHLRGTYNLETWQGAYCFIDAGATVNAETASELGNVRIEESGRLVVGDYTLNVVDSSAAVKWVLYYNKGHFIVTNALTNTSSVRTSMFSNNSGEADTAFYGTNIIERLVNTPTADVEFLLGKYGDVGTGFNEWVRGTYQFGAVTWGERVSPIVGWRACSPKIYFAKTSTLAAVADGQYIGCLEDEKYYACDVEGNPSDITLECDLSYVDYGGCLYGVTFGGGGKFTLAAGRKIKRDGKTVTVAGGTTLALMPGSNIIASSLSVQSGSSLEVATSGTVTFDASTLQLADGAALAFNFSSRRDDPVLDLTGKTLTANGAVRVKISADSGKRPFYGNDGKHILTSGGKFTGKTVELAEGSAKWVKGVSVSETGDIVIDIKPMGSTFTVR